MASIAFGSYISVSADSVYLPHVTLTELKFVSCVTPVYSRVMVHLICVHNRQAMHAFAVEELCIIIFFSDLRQINTVCTFIRIANSALRRDTPARLLHCILVIFNRRQRWKEGVL